MKLRFGITDLALLIAACAAICWCASQVGMANRYFWFVVLISAVYSCSFIRVTGRDRPSRSAWPLIWLVMCLLGAGGLPIAMVLLVSALLHVLADLTLNRNRRSYARAAQITLGCTVAAFVVVAVLGLPRSRQIRRWLREYAVVSVASRLAYEPARVEPTSVKLAATIRNDLDNYQRYLGRSLRRSGQLLRLHSRTAEEFMRSQGFGFARMTPLREQFLQLPPLVSIPFDRWQVAESSYPWEWNLYEFRRDDDAVREFHQVALLDFLNPTRFGSVSGFRQVAGFVPHAFYGVPNDVYQLTHVVHRLQLVSLQRYQQPMVYLSEVLPRMDQLSAEDVPVRELDAFEVAALPQLETEADVVYEETREGQRGALRMLGSLRASATCLDCHGAREGQLLGAFSYWLSDAGSFTRPR